MVPCVPIIIMLYKKATIRSLILRYLKRNNIKKGARHNTITQLINESQFFLFLNTFSLEKNSLKIVLLLGSERLPCASFHPYEGGSSTLFKKAILSYLVYNLNALRGIRRKVCFIY